MENHRNDSARDGLIDKLMICLVISVVFISLSLFLYLFTHAVVNYSSKFLVSPNPPYTEEL
jgi:hypothetical protein